MTERGMKEDEGGAGTMEGSTQEGRKEGDTAPQQS